MNGCQCPTPDTIRIPTGHGQYKTILLKWNDDIILHGKKATCVCENCGQGLCDDCRVLSDKMLEDWELAWPAATILCPDCEEEL